MGRWILSLTATVSVGRWTKSLVTPLAVAICTDPGWYSMSHENREKLRKVRDDFQRDTLEIRKQLVVKQMELTTLSAKLDLEPVKAEKLSNEIAQLQAALGKNVGNIS